MDGRGEPEKPLSPSELVADLRRLGITAGDHVGVGISLRSLGPVAGGVRAVIGALLDAVGPEGTIVMNTYTDAFQNHELRRARAGECFYDAAVTPCYTGAVAEVLRTYPRAVRSLHPTNSIVACGRLGEFFARDHDANADAYHPYSLIAETNGKILSIGIGDNLVGFRHQAQHLAGLLPLVRDGQLGVYYRDSEGRRSLYVRPYRSGCIRKLPSLVAEMRERGMAQDGAIGGAGAVAVPAREAMDYMVLQLKSSPERYLCEDWRCVWCREVEAKLNLYSRFAAPRWFQRSPAGALVVKLRNRFVIDLNSLGLPVAKAALRSLGIKRRPARSAVQDGH